MPKVIIHESKGLHQVSGTGSHLTVNGTAPTIAFSGGSAAGNIEAQSTDMAGIINVTTQIASANTATVTFAAPYDTAPTVVCGSLINYKVTSSTTGFVITGTGNTGTGEIHYIVIRSV